MPTYGALPWEQQSALQPEILMTVASWIREVRDSVAELIDEDAVAPPTLAPAPEESTRAAASTGGRW